MASILIIVIPVLILMGYYLALVSNRLRLDAYSKHVVAEVDQLNSFLENDVNSNNLFNLKILGFVFLITQLSGMDCESENMVYVSDIMKK